MEKQVLKFGTQIKAPKEKVWDVLLQDETYRQWTTPFCEGSYAVGDWQQGSKVLFLTPDGEGMVSKVVVNRPFEELSLEHMGMVKDGVEDFESDAVKGWQGSRESYYLTEKDGETALNIVQDITPQYAESFTEIWQKALQKVKELSEAN